MTLDTSVVAPVITALVVIGTCIFWLGRLTGRVDSLRNDLKDLQSTVNSQQNDLKDLQSTVNSQQNEITSLKTSLDYSRPAVSNLQSDVKTLQSDVTGLKTSLEAALSKSYRQGGGG